MELYLRRLEKLEQIANSFPGVDKSYALQAGREIRVLVEPSKISRSRDCLDKELILREAYALG
jgi:ribonucrease Y